MRILLTRPREDSERTAELLRARGHDVLISPLMEIRLVDGPEISFEGVQAILVTSANGIRALARRTLRRDLSIFAVGPQTTLAARAAGFTDVSDADGDGAVLSNAVMRSLRPQGGALFYAAGREQRGNVVLALGDAGFDVRCEILYEATPLLELTGDATAAFGAGNIDTVMLYSPRSAETFVAAIEKIGLADQCASMIAICLSEAVAATLAPLRFADVLVAKHPNQDSMLSVLEQIAR